MTWNHDTVDKWHTFPFTDSETCSSSAGTQVGIGGYRMKERSTAKVMRHICIIPDGSVSEKPHIWSSFSDPFSGTTVNSSKASADSELLSSVDVNMSFSCIWSDTKSFDASTTPEPRSGRSCSLRCFEVEDPGFLLIGGGRHRTFLLQIRWAMIHPSVFNLQHRPFGMYLTKADSALSWNQIFLVIKLSLVSLLSMKPGRCKYKLLLLSPTKKKRSQAHKRQKDNRTKDLDYYYASFRIFSRLTD